MHWFRGQGTVLRVGGSSYRVFTREPTDGPGLRVTGGIATLKMTHDCPATIRIPHCSTRCKEFGFALQSHRDCFAVFFEVGAFEGDEEGVEVGFHGK